jgi:hypothetical protein
MPGYNRRGPAGEGPRTGRNMGKCRPLDTDVDTQNSTEDAASTDSNGLGRGGRPWGCGRGFGGGMRAGNRAVHAGRAGRAGRGHGMGGSGGRRG